MPAQPHAAGILGRYSVCESHVRPALVIVLAPCLDRGPRLGKRLELSRHGVGLTRHGRCRLPARRRISLVTLFLLGRHQSRVYQVARGPSRTIAGHGSCRFSFNPSLLIFHSVASPRGASNCRASSRTRRRLAAQHVAQLGMALELALSKWAQRDDRPPLGSRDLCCAGHQRLPDAAPA